MPVHEPLSAWGPLETARSPLPELPTCHTRVVRPACVNALRLPISTPDRRIRSSHSSETKNGEEGRVHAPLLLWAETAGHVTQPADIDGSHLFDQNPRPDAVDDGRGFLFHSAW